MPTLDFNSTLKYTPVKTGEVSIKFPMPNVNYDACNTGTLDIPAGTSEFQTFQVPFGSVNSAVGFYLKNNSGQELSVFINENFTHSMADQGTILITMPAQINTKVEVSLPLSSVTLVTSKLQKKTGTVEYMVFGA